MKVSLRSKMLLIAAAIMLTVISVITVINALISVRAYNAALESRTEAIAQSLTLQFERLLQLGLDIDSIIGFEAQTREIVEAYAGIDLAMVVAPDGRVLFQSGASLDRATGEFLEVVRSGTAGSAHAWTDKEEHLSIVPAHNLQGEHVASVAVGFPEALVVGKLKELVWSNVAIGGLVLLLGYLALYHALSRFITRPLESLTHTVTALREHPQDLARRTAVSSQDELGRLGTAFNALMDELQVTTVSKVKLEQAMQELWRLSDELFEQKERIEVTLRSIGDAVISVDTESRIRYLNPVAERMANVTLEDVSGRLFQEVFRLVNATTKATLPRPFDTVFRSGKALSSEIEAELQTHDGSCIGVTYIASPMHDPNGALAGGVLVLRDVSAERHMAQRLSWEASHDALTGLVNRREFNARMGALLEASRGTDRQHVVCFMDLDRFKVVNDSAGHSAGDELLTGLAEVLLGRLRHTDTLARLGGDEFALLMEDCSLEDAQRIATELLSTVGEFRLDYKGRFFSVGMSIGLAVTGRETSGADVLSMADVACYLAKEQGRNRVCTYRTDNTDMTQHRREADWVARINAALDEDRFTLYHQTYLSLDPQANAREHMEVLLRMIDEQGRLVMPGSFLPAAERYGLMPRLDRWVIAKVFSGYRELLAERGGWPLTCAINLSGTSLNDDGLFDFIRQQAERHRLPLQSICFEITETSAINNLRSAATFIQGCKSLGFLFALDDFGTGTSSFGYLKNLPVDYLKIDGGFVRNIDKNGIDRAMTETINRIGHIMGIQTVAEYAENDDIIQRLRGMGVNYAQGYGISRPTPLFEAPPIEQG
ncbi:EAL domain-containing protein [Billgrantia saliphila]|uniref:EAL domain-containing protein n=1 Tax=Billgrantia saliphila TaxID=1848458 RepID=UPI000CE34274|nr:EAL domain-containing protein [Halomonas saliphila]